MIAELVLEKYKHLRTYYKTDEEFKEHLLGGEVTASIKDMIELFEEEQRSFNTDKEMLRFAKYYMDYQIRMFLESKRPLPDNQIIYKYLNRVYPEGLKQVNE